MKPDADGPFLTPQQRSPHRPMTRWWNDELIK